MKQETTITGESMKGAFMSYGPVILLFIAMFYVSFSGMFNYSTFPKWIVVAILVLPFTFLLKTHSYKWKHPATIWILFVAWYLFQCFNSYNFWEAITHTIPMLLAPIVARLILSGGIHSKSYLKVSRVLAICLTPLLLLTVFELMTLLVMGEYNHQATYTFRYSFGHRNQFAQVVALTLPFLLYGFIKESGWKKWGMLCTSVLSALVVALLWNRTSILIVFGWYPVLVVAFFLYRKWGKSKKALVIFFGMMTLAIASMLVPSIRKNTPVVGQLFETDFGSGNERVRLWSNSVDLWKESSMLGHGSGDWKIEISRTDLIHTQAEHGFVFYQRAHNDFLQVLVENGLVGFLLFALVFVWGAIRILRSPLERTLKLFMFMGLTGFVLIANFSFPLERIELLVLLFLFIYAGGGSLKEGTTDKKSYLRKAPLICISLSLLLLSIKWVGQEMQYFEYKRTGDLLKLKELEKDFYTIDATAKPIYWEQANIRFAAGDFEGASKDYLKSLRYNPYDVHGLNNIASCYYALGNTDKAEDYYRRALKLNPRFSESLVNYAAIQMNKKDIDGALNTILEVPLDQEPSRYKIVLGAIAKAKCEWLIDLHDEPVFKQHLKIIKEDRQYLYQISVDSRKSSRSYEDELRFALQSKNQGNATFVQ